ncbi:hypothetical protein BDFB_014581 [Asbolus verrucosus]|uniref:Uncharacterized protein n=1 Tax=Asbolus verrucosus TaxID=1661398 RepID=A0A482VR06_ASBVE|nr:hypothetical protein BDFB_014581 [Asbolus verrucosus]
MATAFMLAHPYGIPRVMCSFAFETREQDPSQTDDGVLISSEIDDNGTCNNGYLCEHRWRQIFSMVEFRNVVEGTKVKNWWSNNDQQIAFSRSMGFVSFTSWGDLNENLYTNLPWNLL